MAKARGGGGGKSGAPNALRIIHKILEFTWEFDFPWGERKAGGKIGMSGAYQAGN